MVASNGNGANGHGNQTASAATKLRRQLKETDDLILLPGVYDGFSARIAIEVGFDGLYMVPDFAPFPSPRRLVNG